MPPLPRRFVVALVGSAIGNVLMLLALLLTPARTPVVERVERVEVVEDATARLLRTLEETGYRWSLQHFSDGYDARAHRTEHGYTLWHETKGASAAEAVRRLEQAVRSTVTGVNTTTSSPGSMERRR